MSKYSTITTSNGFAMGTVIRNNDSGEYFGGYNFMGSINWLKTCYDAVLMDQDEANQIIADLESADEPAEPETDPMIERFQRSLDSAVEDRDYNGNKWNEMINDGKHSDRDCNRMYIRYQQAQGFLEGLTNAIFIAGYRIISSVDSTKLTVAK